MCDLDWTKEDFNDSSAPYVELYEIEDPFQRQQAINQMSDYAKTVGVKNFLTLYKMFERSVSKPKGYTIVNNATNFADQPIELDSGGWTADEGGIYKTDNFGGRIYACTHPVLPVERLENIDTGEEKLRLAYRKGKAGWRTLIADKRTLASASKVTELAGNGISVTSDNAKQFIRYIFELESLNYDRLPMRRSIGRLGHIAGAGFSPYVDGLIFDGDASFKSLFDAVTSKGRYDGVEDCWLFAAQWSRRMSITAKVILAASFASPLLDPLGVLPFFVHLWGVDSGTGKTVALMLAASVWGNPAIGAYIKTFDSTAVGCEKTAAFLNHLPLCLDELQLSKDNRGRSNFDVYKLAEGVGRTRGNKAGGVDITPTWRCTILTTGESPLTGTTAGAGAVNRVIDIECASGEPAVPAGSGMWLSGLLKRHYGHAGRKFVEHLYGDEGALEEAKKLYEGFFATLTETDTTEKQAMAASAILTADTLACEWIFGGQEKPMTVDEMGRFLASKQAVSAGERGYDFLLSWVAMNKAKFQLNSDTAELWGELEYDCVYIVATKLRDVLENAGFSYNATLSWLDSEGLLLQKGTDKKRRTIKKRIDGVATWCVCVRMDTPDSEE